MTEMAETTEVVEMTEVVGMDNVEQAGGSAAEMGR